MLALLLRAYRIILPSTKLWVASKHVLQRAELFGNRVIFNVTKLCTICILAYSSLFVNVFLTKRKKIENYFSFPFKLRQNMRGKSSIIIQKGQSKTVRKERNDSIALRKMQKKDGYRLLQ